jgi:N-acetylglucosamine-6-phosphate deacetylase
MLVLTASLLYTPLQRIDQPFVLIEGTSIVSLGSQADSELPRNARVVDFGDRILAPGMLDIHIHGAAGYDVMQADKPAHTLMEQFLARHGVTSYYPTTVTAPLEATLAALERLADAIESAANRKTEHDGRCQPLGIHLEGPFLSHVRRGVHPPENLLTPTISVFDKFWQAARGRISLMTIAPELEGAPELIAEASKRGVCVSLGHSDAGLDSTRAAVAAGARHATHTFNAMRPLDHRAPGILGEVLTNQGITADVIADGVHVDPTVVQLLLKAKGPEGAALITDATAATGMPDGRYRLGPFEVEVKEGKCLYEGKLAGSVLTLDRAVRNVMDFAHWDLQTTLRLATLNPAQIARAPKKGMLQPGADADFVVLSSTGEIQATIAKGNLLQ